MVLPKWFDDDKLLPDSAALKPLERFFAIVTPWDGRPMSISIERAINHGAGTQTVIGTGTFWSSDQARFSISAAPNKITGVTEPKSAWVAKPVAIASGIDLPGLTTSTFWMVLTASVMDEPWQPDPNEPPMLPMSRHLVGIVEVAGKPVLTRLNLRGETFTAELDFAGDLSDIERAAMGKAPAGLTGHGLTFVDLAGLFGNEHDPHADLKWLPDVLQNPIQDLATGVALNEVYFRVDPDDDKKLVAVGARVGLGTGTPWRIIPGFDFLTVDDIEVAFDVEHPLDPGARFPSVEVSGAVRLGVSDAVTGKKPAEIGVQARWPDMQIAGQLRSAAEHSAQDGKEHPVYILDLLEALSLPAIVHGEGPTISELSFHARPTGKQKSFAIHGTLEDVLSFPVGPVARVELRRVDMALAVQRGEQQSLSAHIGGELALGSSAVSMSANCDQGGDGWTLQGWLVGEPIEINSLEEWIADRFGGHVFPKDMLAAVNPEINEMSMSFNTASKDAQFHLRTDFKLTDKLIGGLSLDMALAHHGGDHFERRIGGRLQIGDGDSAFSFDLLFTKEEDKTPGAESSGLLIAAYQGAGGRTVGDFLEAVLPDGVAPEIPIVLSDALLAHGDNSTLILADMGMGFDLTHLPFVGKMLPKNQNLSLDLRVVVASVNEWDADKVGALNDAMPEGYGPIDAPDTGKHLGKVSLQVALGIGDMMAHLDLDKLGLEADESSAAEGVDGDDTQPAKMPVATPATGDEPETHWIAVQRKLGPIHLRRVGARFDGSAKPPAISLGLDGDVSFGGLTLSLDGLTVSTPLEDPTKHFAPTFDLKGLGLDVNTGAVEIGGALLRTGEFEFAGSAIVRTEQMSLSALGSFGQINGETSLFVYAVLDYPLGGPSFFFVTGLAAGFGYNRKLVMPKPDDIAEFPLITEAVAGAVNAEPPTADGLTAKLQALARYVPHSPGDLFLAIGVKFTSFKAVDSFALLVASIGSQFRLDVLGMSTLVVPTPEAGKSVTPLAEIQIALHAQFVPDEGLLGVDTRLTPASYVLSKDCHLEGGFAFYSWFSGPHSGDFVVTMGGYHPNFVPPAHYPAVPRLGFHWKVSDSVEIKGTAYYALTGHALMAGVHLNATYHSGAFRAWFRMGADFLIAWQPYHYDARAYISIGAKWHFIEADFAVDVHVWGPEFAGKAYVDIGPTSFTVKFGPQSEKNPQYLKEWSQFQGAFLPAQDEICTIACQTGLVRQLEPAADDAPDAEWVVSAHDMVLAMSSQVPSTAVMVNDKERADWADRVNSNVAIGPMNVDIGEFAATLNIVVKRDGAMLSTDQFDANFRLEPILKRVPSAMWGEPALKPSAGGADDSWLDNTLAGVELRPKPPKAPEVSAPQSKAELGYTTDVLDYPNTQPPGHFFTVISQAQPNPETARAEIDVARARRELLAGLGIDPATVRPGPALDESYLVAPRLGQIEQPPVPTA